MFVHSTLYIISFVYNILKISVTMESGSILEKNKYQ